MSYISDYNPVLTWEPTPKWHPRRLLYKQTWRRFLPYTEPLLLGEGEGCGRYQYMTDFERAKDALREMAGLPDETLDEAYH